MRSLVLTLILLVAAIAAVLVTAPLFVDWNDYRGLLTRQAEALTGGAVAIEGRISVSLLPSPTLSLAETTLTGDHASGQVRLAIDRTDLRLRPLSLLRGQVQVGDIRLVRPVLELDRAPDQDAASPADRRNPVLSLIGIRPNRLSVVDGHALVRDEGAAWRIDAIDLDMQAQDRDGPFALRGSFASAAREFDLVAQIGRFSPDNVGTLHLTLAALGEQPATLRYSGAAWWHLDDLRLRGTLILAGENAPSVVALALGVFGHAAPPLPSWLDHPFEVTGKLQLDSAALQLDELQLSLAEARAAGQLSLTFGADATMMLALQSDRLELGDRLAARPADLAPLAALSRAVRGQIDLSVGGVHYRNRSAERVRLRLRLAGDGEVAVDQASAILPGQTDLRFEGGLRTADGRVQLGGQAHAVSDDLGSLLAWLDLRPPGVASGRLRTLSLSSALLIEDDGLQLSELEVRLDATQLRGSAALDAGVGAGARPRLALDVMIDRLNVDAYQPDLLPAEAAGLLRRALRDADAEISTRVGRLTWRGLLLRDVAIALRADDGRLQVREASLDVAGEAEARLDGEIDLASGAFAWSTEVRSTSLARLLRRLDLDPPLMLARVPPLTLVASATGRPEQFDLKAEIDDGAGTLTAAGDAGWVGGSLHYGLEIQLDHPDFSALVRPLGARTALDASQAALSFTGKLTGAAAQHSIAGSARLGEMSLTGLLAWQRGEQPRPRYDLQLSVAEPTWEILAALLELSGLAPAATLLDAPVLGNWPRQALRLERLSQFDGSLKLSAKGGLAGEGVELDARLQQAKLFVDRASVRAAEGTLSTEFTLDTDRPLPFLAASVDLDDIDAAWLAARLGLDPVLEGRLDLLGEATAAGRSPYDLVRSLIGRFELAISSGRLVGGAIAPIRQALSRGGNDHEGPPLPPSAAGEPAALPFADLVAHFSLDRGIASSRSADLEIDGAAASVSGSVDLLLWAADMSVEITPPARPDEVITLQIVGPLKRPQTRLTLPPTRPAATAAP